MVVFSSLFDTFLPKDNKKPRTEFSLIQIRESSLSGLKMQKNIIPNRSELKIHFDAVTTFPHSPIIYGYRVETLGPYSHYYTREMQFYYDKIIIPTLQFSVNKYIEHLLFATC